MLLILLKHIQSVAYQNWARESIGLLPEETERTQPVVEAYTGDRSEGEFPIPFQNMNISRSDVRLHVGTDIEVLLSNDDMRQLAIMLGSAYIGSGMIWDDLEMFARQLVEGKQ